MDKLNTDNNNDSILYYMNQMEKVSDRATQFVQQLFQFSRKDSSVQKNININDIIKNLISMLHHIIGDKIILNCHLGDKINLIRGEISSIEQILMNLIINAKDELSQGGVISIVTKNIKMEQNIYSGSEVIPGEYVEINVIDSGRGVSKEIAPQIFNSSFTTKDLGKGTGLGLFVVKNLIEQHNGYIYLDQSVKQGSKFVLLIPSTPDKNVQDKPMELADMTFNSSVNKKQKILAVDDDKSILDFIKLSLMNNKYQVFTAEDLSSAINLFKDNQNIFDLLFYDLSKTDDETIHLLDEIYSLKPKLNIILATNTEDQNIIQKKNDKWFYPIY